METETADADLENALATLAEAHTALRETITSAESVASTLSRAEAHLVEVGDAHAANRRAQEDAHRSAVSALLGQLQDGTPKRDRAAPSVPAGDDLAEDVRTARAAVAALLEDHAVALAVVADARTQVDRAARAAMLSEAEILATELVQTQSRATSLRARLQAFLDLGILPPRASTPPMGGSRVPGSLIITRDWAPPDTRHPIERAVSDVAPELKGLREAEQTRWRERKSALCAEKEV